MTQMENDNRNESYAFVPDLFLPDLFTSKEFYPGNEQSVPVFDQQEGQSASGLIDATDVSRWLGDQTTGHYGFGESEGAPSQGYPSPYGYPLQTQDGPLYGGGAPFTSTIDGAPRVIAAAAAAAAADAAAPAPVGGTEAAADSQLPPVTSPLCCPVCCRTFRHKLGLTNHQRVHTARQPHTCSICGETFKYKTNFKRHRRVHAKEMKICRYCGVNMESDYDLVQHEKEHRRLQKM